MSDDRPSEVLGALPRTRPHRRSEKRSARPVGPAPSAPQSSDPTATEPKSAAQPKPASAANPRPRPRRLPQPAQPGGTPATPRTRTPAPTGGSDLLGTAVQAAAELAEIGLSVSARALRRAVSRLPRP